MPSTAMMMQVHMTEKQREDRAARILTEVFRHAAKYHSLQKFSLFGSKLSMRDLREANRRIQVRSTIREICLYVIFLTFFTYSSIITAQDQDIYHMGNNLRNQLTEVEFKPHHAHVLKTFTDVATMNEFYQWLEGPFFDFLYTGSSELGDPHPNTPGFVYFDTRKVGGVRIAQLRTKRFDCTGLPNFKDHDLVCHGVRNTPFNLDVESHEDFGDVPGRPFKWDGSGWGEKVQTVDEERSMPISSFRTGEGRTYPPPAYSVILPNANQTQAWDMLQMLREGNYIDRATRVVMVDLTLYNPNIDLFSFVRLTVEAGKAGGARTGYHASTTRLYIWFEAQTLFNIIAELIVVGFYLYFIIVEVLNCREYGIEHFWALGTILHNLNLILYVGVWVLRGVSFAVSPDVTTVDVTSDVYYPFQLCTMYKRMSVYAQATNAFLCWFKLVRFLGYIPRFALVTGTLARSANGVTGFTIIFIVLFYGFSAAHMMTFGTFVEGYKNMTNSALTLMKSLLGDFDLDEMTEAQFIMGPFFFVLFTAVAVFVVLNILIAIISDAYSDEVRHLAESEDVQLGDELKLYIYHKCTQTPVINKLFFAGQRGWQKTKQHTEKLTRTPRAAVHRALSRRTNSQASNSRSPVQFRSTAASYDEDKEGAAVDLRLPQRITDADSDGAARRPNTLKPVKTGRSRDHIPHDGSGASSKDASGSTTNIPGSVGEP